MEGRRTSKPDMVYQKSTQVGPGPAVERVVSRKRELMAAEDSAKILDSLKAEQNSHYFYLRSSRDQ